MNDVLFRLVSLLSIGLTALRATRCPKERGKCIPTKREGKNTLRKFSNVATSNVAAKTEEDILYGKLLSMVLGDKEVAKRLLEYERKKFPRENQSSLIQRAIDRLMWERW